jgi:5'-nucleotidase
MGRNFLLGCVVLAAVAGVGGAACGSGSSAAPVAADAGGEDGATPPAEAGAEAGGLVDVQILAINDFHGNLEPPTGSTSSVVAEVNDPIADAGPDSGVTFTGAGTALVPTGGAAYLAAHVKALRAANPSNTVVVSAGDLTGASPLVSNLFRDEPTVLVMNSLGLDYEGVGNHDFDRGIAELLRLQKGGCSLGDCDAGAFVGARYEYLAANVTDTTTNQTVFPPYAVRTVGDAKIAFVGMTLQGTPAVTTTGAVKGLGFANEAATINALVPGLLAQGVSAIVLLVHQGGFQDILGTYDSCSGLNGPLLPLLKGDTTAGTPALDPRIEVVVSAHTHEAYDCTIDGRLVTSAASLGRVITKIDLTIDTVAKKVVSKKARNVAVTRDIAPDVDVAGIVARYEALAAPVGNRVIGYVTADLSSATAAGVTSCETPLGDVIADAQLAATSDAATGGAVVAFMNGGGIRADLLAKAPGKVDGAISYAEAFAVQPFANGLVTMTLTGAQLLRVLDAQFGPSLEVLATSSSLTYTYSYDAVAHKATIDPTGVMIGGVALDVAKSYRVTANVFLAEGGGGFAAFAEGTSRLNGVVDLEALVAYFGKTSPASPLAPPAATRITGNACK